MGRDGVVLGLSGGLDSSVCAYLLTKALGRNKILALILPERDSSPVNMDHARLVAKNLGLKTLEINLTDVLTKMGVYEIGPRESRAGLEAKGWRVLNKTIGPVISDIHSLMFGGERVNKAFKRLTQLTRSYFYDKTAFMVAKIRLRMIYLSMHAIKNNYAVVGTTDKTEYTIGHYDTHGDGANDITLLRHLYKTQIRKLAGYLGVPKEITDKPSSADLFGNVPNELTFGTTYEKLDNLLYGIEHGLPVAKIMPKKYITGFKKSIELAKLARSLPLAL